MNTEQIKLRFGNAIKILAKGNKSEFARMIGMSPQNLAKYINAEIAIGIVMHEKLRAIGINSDYITGSSIYMFADNEEGLKLKQLYGDDMSVPQKQGVKFIPTTNPAPMKVPVMLSPVRAGLPDWVSDSIGSEVDVSKLYHEKSYYVVAHGDSMTSARIHEGDWLLVDELKEAKNGNVVLAEVDGALTVKRLKRNGKTWLLHPDTDNPTYQPIELSDAVRIIAVVQQIIVQP